MIARVFIHYNDCRFTEGISLLLSSFNFNVLEHCCIIGDGFRRIRFLNGSVLDQNRNCILIVATSSFTSEVNPFNCVFSLKTLA